MNARYRTYVRLFTDLYPAEHPFGYSKTTDENIRSPAHPFDIWATNTRSIAETAGESEHSFGYMGRGNIRSMFWAPWFSHQIFNKKDFAPVCR